MHHNIRNFPLNENIEGRKSNLDIPSHGKVPRWLEDMSSNVERSHSLIMERNYLEPNNNDKYHLYSSTTNINYDSKNSTPSSSAKFGRRSASNSQFSTPIKKHYVNLDMETYLVPKTEEVNFNNMSEHQMDEAGFKNVCHSENSNREDQELESYSPSCLEQKLGRRSRLDILSDQISNSLKDLSISDAHMSTTNKLTSTNKTVSTTLFNSFKKLDSKAIKVQKPQKDLSQSDPFSSYLFTVNDSEIDRRKSFEEELFLLKNKVQKYKKSKQQQAYKHKNLALMRKEQMQNTSEDFLPPNENKELEEVFIIPERPAGLIMIVDILSTWGDKFYVGLNGIEIFDSDGNVVPVKNISACPEDINILPECEGDPRVVTNLLDGVNRTQDDMHLWLTPFDAGEHHLITIEFYKKTELAMIRIWNYNKSRIHSYRGARDVIITLDGVCIFQGEIAQACGSILGGIESFGDTILFTTEEKILENIAQNDISFTTLMSVSDKELPERIERPATASASEETHQRPYTHAFTQKHDLDPGDQLFAAQRLDIVLVMNWGRLDYIGLTGLEVIGDSDISLTITKENLRSNNMASSAMLFRIIDDENITTDRKHMWYTQYILGEEIVLSVIFDQITYIAGIRIWNYNENIEMSFCGARMIKILIDNKPMINPLTNDSTFLLRRAPGNTHYDYVQEIRFSQSSFIEMLPEPFYELNNLTGNKEDLFDNPIMPEGFVFQIVLYTTWGDHYYVGLNGIEVFDQDGKKIVLTESNICAHPESVNVLPGVSGDIRTPDKLVDGINDRSDGTHSWLVPVIPKCLNRIYIVFDQPVTISVMKLWNYLKTPTRGVKEFGILVDDLLIYNGILDKINEKSFVKYRTILFTNNRKVIQKEMASLVKHSIDSQATILTNDEPRVTTGGSLPNADQSLRPFTSVNYLSRGRTSQSH